MDISLEDFRRHFEILSDEALLATSREDLVETARACFDEEVVRRGLKKLAAFKDEAGALHLRSASCTHVGCHLHWNSFETCWDCPCHGSMFDVDGQPINAPAIGPLARVED